MRVALAQLDSRLGDLEANAARARATIVAAGEQGADLVVFPELQLTGYAVAGSQTATAIAPGELLELVAPAGNGSALLLGFHELDGGRTYNSAAYVEQGAPLHVHRKLYLVDYPPFDEDACFDAGQSLRAFDSALGRLAVLVCNDAWQPVLPALAVQDGAEVLLMPAASSTEVPEAEAYWRDLTRFYARFLQCYVIFVNRVGDEGGFRFWGGSHVVDPLGGIVAEAPRLDEALVLAELDLELVRRRRRELPLFSDGRPALLAAEFARLANDRPGRSA